MTPLAASLLRLARAWFDETTVTGVFEPLVADLQRAGRARLVSAFAITFVVSLPRQLTQDLPREISVSAWTTAAIFLAIGVATNYALFPSEMAARAPWLLLPAFFTFSLPYVIPAVTVVVASHARTHRDTLTVLVRSLCLIYLLLLPCLAWLTPMTNQAWRVAAAPAPAPAPVRGARELYLQELLAAAPPEDARIPASERRDELHSRMSFAASPMTLAIFGLAFARSGRRDDWLRAMGVWTLSALVFASLFRAGELLPHGVLLALAAAVHVGRGVRPARAV